VQTIFGLLSGRSALGWLRERDIDLLICSELHAGGGSLTRFLTSRLAGDRARFVRAWVSHADIDGESDLLVAFEQNGRTIIALIENKIAAIFQPDQALRYRKRAERWAKMDGISSVVTVLIAPEEYMSHAGSSDFDQRVTYEAVANVLRSEPDCRASFTAEAILTGIAQCRAGYVMRPNEAVTEMWNVCWEIACRVAPSLNFERTGEKPGESTWFYFRKAAGFEGLRGAVVVYKAERGQVDLQFSGTSPTELARRSLGLLDTSMKVVPAAKSASVRLSVPVIDFHSSASAQEAKIVDGFMACERLRLLFVEHRGTLLPDRGSS
jgi:hypothetical protein